MVLRASKALRLIGREKFNSGTVVKDDFTVVAVPGFKHSVTAKDSKDA
jgi:hypothetical protein